MKTGAWSKKAAHRDLRRQLRGRVVMDRPLKRYTTYRVGGPADLFCEPADRRDLAVLLQFVQRHGVPFFVIGSGANLLVSDRGVRGVVISLLKGLNECVISRNRVKLGAGAILRTFLQKMQHLGLGGLERLYGIPGTIGGAIHMNAGAFGSEISDRLLTVDVMDREGRMQTLQKHTIPFGYRIGYREPGKIVLGIELSMKRGDPATLRQTMDEIWMKRKRRQPLSYPSAGSVFKRPPGGYAGVLIEQAGLKGRRCGGAVISTKHANFILNKGGATAADIYNLIQEIQETCRKQFGVDLELENQLVGWDA